MGKCTYICEAPIERKMSNVERQTLKAPIKLGERVIVSTLNAEGLVTALGESDAEIQIGTLRVRARLSDLLKKSGEPVVVEEKKKVTVRETITVSSKSPGMEVDLRGLMSEDALAWLGLFR